MIYIFSNFLILITNYFVTNYAKLGGVKQHTLVISVYVSPTSRQGLGGFPPSESYQAVMQVSARAVVSSAAGLGKDPLPNSIRSWTESVPLWL